MQVKIYKDHHAMSDAVSDEVINLLKDKPDAVLCFASGETPRLTCQLLVKKLLQQKIDLGRSTFIGLDEWVGISPANEGSCHYFFQHQLFEPLQYPARQTHLFNALSDDLEEECRKMDAVIAQKGGIDLMIVGIGMNGHIGFNEPGVSFNNYSHVIDLDDTTLTVGQKYFKTTVRLQKGITLGLKHLLDAQKTILIANGAKKAEVIRKTVEEKLTADFPASIMQTHPNGSVMVDEDAASLLDSKKYDRVL